jgi:asparagine synthase (glutamine-hydrolysing)
VKVALSGDGADELFGSYLPHRLAIPMSLYGRLRERALSGDLTPDERDALAPCDTAYLDNLYAQSGDDMALWRYLLYPMSDKDKDGLLSGEFMGRVNGVSSQRLVRQMFGDLTAQNPLNRVLEMEFNGQFPDQVLAFVDFLSMAHSVEVRSPFLDYRLVEFAATIPGGMKIKNGIVKSILKKAVGGLLPEGITERPKEGFVMPVYTWMTDGMKDYILDALAPSRTGRHGLLREEGVAELLSRYYSGDGSLSGRVWNVLMFQLWWEKYFG